MLGAGVLSRAVCLACVCILTCAVRFCVCVSVASVATADDDLARRRKRLFYERTMQKLASWLAAELFPDEQSRPALQQWSLKQ